MSHAADRPDPQSIAAIPTELNNNAQGPRMVALLSDMLASVRLEPAARQIGCALAIVERAEQLPAALHGAAAVILDLTDPVFPFPATYSQVRDSVPEAPVLAFYPHVRDDLAAIARSAGCELVMPRSKFFSDPAAAMRSALSISRSRAG